MTKPGPEAKHPAAASPQRQALLLRRLHEPVDIGSLAFVRIAFGAILLWEVARYFSYGLIELTFLRPSFRFTYHGLEWLPLWPGPGLYLHFAVLGFLAFLVTIGFWYRPAIALFWMGFTHVALLDKTQYLNHFYLVSLLSFLLIFVPAHRAWSVDAWLRPGIASDTAPTWALWILRFQVAIPYVYGGVAKLNADWLDGQPMQLWMSRMEHVRAWVPQFGEHWLALVFSYGGLVLDLFVVPLLLWRPTRAFAFCWVIAFHVTNAIMFHIGIFPWLMIAATTLFFEPDWPRRVWARVAVFGRGFRTASSAREEPRPPDTARQEPRPPGPDRQLLWASLLALYVAVQILVPFRHLLTPGNVDWTEEGTLFSWRMMLNDKPAAVQFLAVDPATRGRRPLDPRAFLIQHQIDRMARDPEMIREFAAYLKDAFRETGLGEVEIHVIAFCSLNGRKPQLLVDPSIDLGAEPRRWGPQPFVVPLVEPRLDPPWNVPPAEWPRHVKMPTIE